MFQNYTFAFDLDGTLVDTAPDLVRAANEVMDMIGIPHVSEDEMRHIVGRGARISIEKAAANSNYEIKDDEMTILLPAFLATYRAGISIRSRAYDGVSDILQELQDKGAKLVVCTNKPTDLSKLLLDQMNLSQYFLGIYGPDTTPAPKPDPRHIITAIEGVNGDIAKSIMVGDSENDVLAAKAANVPVIVTSFGYTTKKASDLGADAIFNHYSEFFKALESVL